MKKQIIVRLTETQKNKLEKQAEAQGRSMNSYIVNLIEQDSKMVRIPVLNNREWKQYQDYVKNFPVSDPRD